MSARRRRLGPWPVLAWLWIRLIPCLSMVPPQCPMGQPQRGLRHLGLVQLGWGCSTKDGWSEAPTKVGGGLEAQSAWQRALALMARPAAHSQCMQAPLWRAQSGGAELMSQVVVTGATVRASDLSREPERLPCRRVRCRALPAPWRWASQVGMTSLGRRGK